MRVTAYVRRFIHNFRTSAKLRQTDNLSAEEIDNAELLIISTYQRLYYEDACL